MIVLSKVSLYFLDFFSSFMPTSTSRLLINPEWNVERYNTAACREKRISSAKPSGLLHRPVHWWNPKMPVCVWVYGASCEIGCKVRRHDCRLYERLRCKEKEIWRGSGSRPPVWEHCRRVVLCNLYGPQVFYRPICLGLQTAHFATKWTRRQFGLGETKLTTWKRIGWWGVTGSFVHVDTFHVTSRSSGID